MKRRDFIRLTGIGSATALISPSFFVSGCKKDKMMGMITSIKVIEGDFSASLAIPQIVLANGSPALNSQITTSSIIKGKTTRVFGYHESILGPTLKMNSGETANIFFSNFLAEETNIHWHGLLIPQNMDGHPENTVNAGSSFSYNFPINQRAGTYWYHPHPHRKTAYQVFMGLAGMFIVNDAEESILNLPLGNYEIPLVIQDKRIYSDYSLNYSPTDDEVMTGYLGQYVCVNGIYSPYQNVATRWYRIRILNGSTARAYNLALSNGTSFTVIGADGGLLSVAENVNNLLLAPGERADILVDFSSYSVGTEIYLQSNSFSGGGEAQGNNAFKIIKFVVDRQETDSFTAPSSLSSIVPIPTTQSSYNRIFDLKQADHNGHAGMNMGNMEHTINGKAFNMNRIDFSVNAGATEIWTFDNSTSEEIHPMHIHGVQFQILDRTGGRGTLIATERGWKDTVLLMAQEKVRVIMTFPNNKGKFVLHCHNLEHEDSGMMLNYEII
jgi:blue copper oxidase